ncbi:hypothetical protein CK203_078925 [Vitis vinifera]|uniref:Uncharacterized protein n=1 Tax=Vitis vinifera TaxID=29760 RepID=A0A438DA53_VITVI|nr:hypothetical protein CK203_078925 [Vitis vinifera]
MPRSHGDSHLCAVLWIRIERLELFDEFEEWHMMQEHYCVAYAINDAMGLLGDFGFPKDDHVPCSPSAAPP